MKRFFGADGLFKALTALKVYDGLIRTVNVEPYKCIKMENEVGITSFLVDEYESLDYHIFELNLYLNAYSETQKPYKIEYNTLLASYNKWRGKDVDEFCLNQTLGYFLSNPTPYDSVGVREAFCIEIREFLLGA